MKAVLVEWRDANSRPPGWEPQSEVSKMELPIVRSIGWLVAEHEDRIVICLDIQDEDCNQAGVIPRSWIVSMKDVA
jgi:hypothetical protein